MRRVDLAQRVFKSCSMCSGSNKSFVHRGKSILDIVRHSIRRQVGGRRGRGSSSAGQLYFFFRAYPVGGCRTPGTQRSSCRNGGFGPRCKDGAHRGGMKKNFVESVYADYSDDLPLSSTPYSVVVPPLVWQTDANKHADCLSPLCLSAAIPISLFGPLKKNP